ncbi:MAG: hypothetical protein GWO20_06570 [Candidatus Korarchaeota archaeon]|nr:hypothetical protein [Candidatus Korarchaeota archaeon]NIU83110.1 hypothetical protein [Candidatus Thorarchaeota archaeon]NIW13488.1 hypothetical protein [Candidatus Thorarchaeota archaeon]
MGFSTRLFIDGNEKAMHTQEGTYAYNWVNIAKGEHTIRVHATAMDEGGNLAGDDEEKDVNIGSDTPSVSITYPKEREATNAHDVTAEWTGHSDFSTIAYYDQLSLALTQLAYAQDAYNTDSKAAFLLIKAVRQLRYHSEHTLPPKYGKLKEWLDDSLKDKPKARDIYYTLQEIEAYEKRLGEEGMENIYEDRVKPSIEDMRETVIPELEKKDRKEILEKLEHGELGLKEKNDRLHDRLKFLLREGTFLVKNGRITVMSPMTIAKLVATERRLKNIHLVKDAPDVDVGESETWFLSSGISLWWVKGRMKGEDVDVSVEGVEEKLGEIKGELQKQGLKRTIKDPFEGEVDATGEGEMRSTELMLGYLKGMRDAISKSRSIGKEQRRELWKKLRETRTDLVKKYSEKVMKNIEEKSFTLDGTVGREEGELVLNKKAKDKIEDILKGMGYTVEEAKEIAGDIEAKVTDRVSNMLDSKKFQQRQTKVAEFAIALTPLGGMAFLLKNIIRYITSNTRLQALLQHSFLGKVVNKLKSGKITEYIQNLVQNFFTGIIVGLMSFVGVVIGTLVVRFTTDKKGLKNALDGDKDLGDTLKENSPLLGFLWFKLPTVAWLVISAVLFPFMLVVISHKYLKEISLGKGGAAIFTGLTGISAYAYMNGKDMFGGVPFFVSLSGMLWIWDEFDDFQDAWDQITHDSNDGTGLVDYAEMFLLPFILGFFGAMFGMTDPMALVIPGRLGFVKYTTTPFPKPWNWIAPALYGMVATLIGGIVASGGVGGFAIYMIGSILANFAMRGS